MKIICDQCGDRVSKEQAEKTMHNTGRVLCQYHYKLLQPNQNGNNKRKYEN
jgi:hypothetical protein